MLCEFYSKNKVELNAFPSFMNGFPQVGIILLKRIREWWGETINKRKAKVNFLKKQLSNLIHGFDTFGPLDLLVLQPTPFCNLACDYCYLADKDDKSKMGMDVLKKTMERVLESGLLKERLTIVWHAGEPTVVGIEYYEEAFKLIDEMLPSNITYHHCFQTNATTINDRWCDLIKKWDVKVGVSVDGPKNIHDKHRVSRNGKGSHDIVQRGMDKLKEHGIYYYTISVVTKDSLDHAQEIFDYLLENGVSFAGFNIEESEGVHINSSLEENGCNEKVLNFFKKLNELSIHSNSKLEIRELNYAYLSIMYWQKNHQVRTYNGQEISPFRIINVDTKGHFSTYSPELLGANLKDGEKFEFGNVMTTSFKDAAQTDKFLAIFETIRKGVNKCRKTCDYYSLCGGGAASNKFFETGRFDSSETNFCKLHKQVPLEICLRTIDEVGTEELKQMKVISSVIGV